MNSALIRVVRRMMGKIGVTGSAESVARPMKDRIRMQGDTDA
jgi:hypothetical protein